MATLSERAKTLILAAVGEPAIKQEIVDLLEGSNVITESEISTGAVTELKIGTGAVTVDKLGAGSVTSPKLDSALIQIADVTIPTASVLDLFDTAYTLIAAPGASNVIVVDAIYSSIDFAAAAYAVGAGETLDIKYDTGATVASLTEAYLEAAEDARQYINVGSTAYEPLANKAIVAQMSATDPTTGDSDIKIRIHYRIVPILL